MTQTQSAETQRKVLTSPVVRIGFGVVLLVFCLAAGDAFVTGVSAPRRDQPGAGQASFYALYAAAVTSALFWSIEAYGYARRRALESWAVRIVSSGLFSVVILFVLARWTGWVAGDLLISLALFFFWRQKKNLSQVDAFNLTTGAMPVALFVSIFLFSLTPFPDLR